jgi:hypothetical protein
MDERMSDWHPTQLEVDEIVRELRPLICDFARRDRETLEVEKCRRHLPKATCR